MQTARHPETTEKKESESQNRGAALSKMTNAEHKSGCAAILKMGRLCLYL
jgi:hypothetical protein